MNLVDRERFLGLHVGLGELEIERELLAARPIRGTLGVEAEGRQVDVDVLAAAERRRVGARHVEVALQPLVLGLLLHLLSSVEDHTAKKNIPAYE